MNYILLAAAEPAAGGGQIQQVAETFGVSWPLLIAQIISFAIVCIFLYKFAYKRVLTILEERRQKIAEGLANAEKSKAELAKAEEERQKILTQANAQANKLIEEARAAAARVKEQETQKAVSEAAQIVAKAREAGDQERARALAEAKKEIGRLVVQTTATVTGKILTQEDQKRLADETARQVAA
jgi:F-type H+-transporting ATPase subunit b